MRSIVLWQPSTITHPAQVPSEIVSKWQEIVDLLAEIVHVPSAFIMRAEPPGIKVFLSSSPKRKPCDVVSLDTGFCCETVIKTCQTLLVPDAREDERWKLCPDSDPELISYLGVPIAWLDGEIFGTLCVCDNKRNEYSGLNLRLYAAVARRIAGRLENVGRAPACGRGAAGERGAFPQVRRPRDRHVHAPQPGWNCSRREIETPAKAWVIAGTN